MISGSTLEYCDEDISLIENYYLAIKDKSQIWECHHRLEIQDDKILSRQDLKNQGLYYKRPASELIFLTRSEHTSLHAKNRSQESKNKFSQKMKGKLKSKEFKEKVSKGLKGRSPSEEHRRHLSESLTGKLLSDKTKKKLSVINTGKKLSLETRKKMSESKIGEKHPMYGKHLSSEQKKKCGKGSKGKFWFTNGITTIFAYECPEGFWPGRTLFIRK